VEIDGETQEFAFDLNEFFKVKPSGSFEHEAEVDRFLDAMTTQNKFPFSTPELRAELKHTFWLLNRVDSARALAKKLQAHPVFRDYEVILAAGDGKLDDTDENQKSFDRVKAAIAHHEKTITLSVGQLTTGVTIPEWSAVLMLSNLKSPALYMQAAFRAQNPCLFHENGTFRRKENAYVFDFDPARTLLIYEQFANDLSQDTASGKGDTEERKAHIQNLLNFFPVIGEDEEGESLAKAGLGVPEVFPAGVALVIGLGVADSPCLLLPQGVGDGGIQLHPAPVHAEILKIPPGLLPIQMEPLIFAVVLHVQLAEVGVEIVVGEHLAAAVIVDGIAPPLLVEQHIGGVGLLFQAFVHRLLGVADLRPAVVPGNFRGCIGVDHGHHLPGSAQGYASHYAISFT
jgi:hypothetical protein